MENILTRIYYLLSSLWLGVLVNLIIATLLVWMVIYFTKVADLKFNITIISAIAFSLAIIVSIYGAWNAFHPKVKNIDVEIKNLPDEWKGKTIIQLSDVHLGHIYREKFIKNIIDEINKINPKVVLITGDLFDGMDGRLEELISPFNSLTPQAYFITGNHETYLGIEKTLAVLKNTPIKILNDELIEIDNLQIIGISFPLINNGKNIKSVIQSQEKFSADKANILMYHTPRGIEEAKELGIDLQLAGHTHKGQQFPFGFITSLIYNGYDYGLYKIGDYYLYTSNGVGAWGPPMRIGNTPEIVAIKLR